MRWSQRLDLGAALLAAALLYLPYFRDTAVPIHDTLWKYQFFHFVYSHFLQFSSLPQWIPDGFYGVASAYLQLALISPSNYLIGGLGAVAGSQNTLLLFKISVFTDFLIHAYGIHLFAREAYQSRLARWMVIIGSLCTISWLVQSHLNFYLYYLFPYSLWAVLKFNKTRRLNYLGILVFVESISFIGNIPYFAPLHLFVLGSIFTVFFTTGKDFSRPALDRQSPFIFAAVTAVAVALIAFAYASTLGTATLATGRDPNTFRVPLDTFLTYGRLTPATTFFGWISGALPNADNTYYVGLLPLFLVCYGVTRIRSPGFTAMMTGFLLLVWLSIGGLAAHLIYFSPGMMLFRHIGLTFALAGLLLLFASGYVLDQLVKGFDVQHGEAKSNTFLIAIILGIFLDLVVSWNMGDHKLGAPVQKSFLALVPLRLILYWVAIKSIGTRELIPRKHLAFKLLLIAFSIDVSTYYLTVIYKSPSVKENYREAFLVGDARFNLVRRHSDNLFREEPTDPKVRFLEETAAKYSHNARYALTYTWLNFDPCIPMLRNDLWHPSILQAITARGGTPRQFSTQDFLPPNDPRFAESIGCASSKIRLVKNYVVAKGTEDKKILKSIDNPMSMVVLRDYQPSYQTDTEPSWGLFEIVDYSANHVTVRILNDAKSALLFYADAWDPRWKATVDGAEATVIRANVGFKAVEVGPGRHLVEFTYGKNDWVTILSNLTALISISAILLAFFGMVKALVRAQSSYPPP